MCHWRPNYENMVYFFFLLRHVESEMRSPVATVPRNYYADTAIMGAQHVPMGENIHRITFGVLVPPWSVA